MADTKKIKRASVALFAAVSLMLVWFIVSSVMNTLKVTAQWNTASVAATVVGTFIMLAVFAVVLVLLKSVRSEETPFNQKNVRRLKIIALLLVAYEPYMFVYGKLMQKLYPIVLEGGISVSVKSSPGGVMLASGIVVYCVALVFEYGISLQRQVDETL